MSSKRAALLVVLVLLFVAPVWATTTTWNFSSPTGPHGNSENYTSDSVTITAYGFSSTQNPTALFGKNESAAESGLGLSSFSDHEISGGGFIQLDLSQVLKDLKPASATIEGGSVQAGESFELWGSNTLGILGTSLGSGDNMNPISLPGLGSYQYLGMTSTSGNVLVEELAVEGGLSPAPEPGTLILMGSALFGAALLFRRFRSPSQS